MIQGILEIKGFAKSLKIQERSKLNVKRRLKATRAEDLRASRVAKVQQLQAHAVAALAAQPPKDPSANMSRSSGLRFCLVEFGIPG